MAGALLDTNALYWLVSGLEVLTDEALVAIAMAQDEGKLFVSPITAWELALAVRKPNNAPQLGEVTARKWFKDAVAAVEARVVPIGSRIALLSASVVTDMGHKDPGDCYIIASAQHKKVPVITRDQRIIQMSSTGFVEAIAC